MIVALGLSCSSSNTPTSWKKPNSHETPIEKVLVVSLGKDIDNRKLLEKELMYRLRDSGYRAEASVDYIRVLNRENVIKIMDSIKADGVLTMQLKDFKQDEKWQRSDRYMGDPGYEYFSNYFDSVYGYSSVQTVAIVETNLYARDDQNIIFAAQSESFDPQSNLEGAVGDFAKSIVISLKQAKVLKKQETKK